MYRPPRKHVIVVDSAVRPRNHWNAGLVGRNHGLLGPLIHFGRELAAAALQRRAPAELGVPALPNGGKHKSLPVVRLEVPHAKFLMKPGNHCQRGRDPDLLGSHGLIDAFLLFGILHVKQPRV